MLAFDGNILYSKAETGRHTEPGDLLDLFLKDYRHGVTLYG